MTYGMKPLLLCARTVLLVSAAVAILWSQAPPREPEEVRLPSGSLQKDEILKEEHRKSLDDAAKLLQLAEELKIELEKNDHHVLSIASIKKTEEIEKLAKRIRSRLKRF